MYMKYDIKLSNLESHFKFKALKYDYFLIINTFI